MATRFGKKGSTGMQGTAGGPLWGVFCYLSGALFYGTQCRRLK
jgi:hypothetical protein